MCDTYDRWPRCPKCGMYPEQYRIDEEVARVFSTDPGYAFGCGIETDTFDDPSVALAAWALMVRDRKVDDV